ncbi:tetratricopeptide repeat protein [Methylovirgula sp. 4M-Z18]|uniref:tetratricopeptide repeat protein n=1 Tax=Methylovirgula sp. 4M-Z18 TaxID=2293567 RepID=UPI0011C045AC|nr:hypothetical protein [Methylovirgula sp. 4M-Z18]
MTDAVSNLRKWLSSPPAAHQRDENRDTRRWLMNEQLQSVEWVASWMALLLFAVVAVYSLAVGGSDPSMGYSWRAFYVFGVFVAAGVAGVIFGGFMGFIFGIPRILRQGYDQTPKTSGTEPSGTGSQGNNNRALPAFAGNTNLEEISDWLTKIIVGLGLTQALNIYHEVLTQASAFQHSAMQGVPGASAFLLIIATSTLVGGFLFFYLETRTRVMLLLSDSDAALSSFAVDQKSVDLSLDAPIGTDHVVEANPSTPPIPAKALSDADKKLLDIPFNDLNSDVEFAAWAGAQARARNYQAAIRAILEAIGRDSGNRRYLIMLGEIRLQQGNAQAAVDAYSEASDKYPDDPGILRREMYASLYVPAPTGFERALQIASKLQKIDPRSPDPMVQVWLAAAYGQQFTWLEQNNGSDADKSQAREHALAAVREAIGTQQNAGGSIRALLRGMLDSSHPDAAPGDDDLKSFASDQEFRNLIFGP